jgi:hypothetical protein
MAARRPKERMKSARMPGIAVSFPPELSKTLEELAKRKKIPAARLAEEVADKYVADQPTFIEGLKR